jgi:hypothetical protein
MPGVSARDYLPHINLSALPRFKRANTCINVIAEQSQFFDVVQHLPPDDLLISYGKSLHLGQGLFQRFRHATEYSTLPPPIHEPTGAAPPNHALLPSRSFQNP